MAAFVQFILRKSGTAALVFFLLAVGSALSVSDGLRRGVGLHEHYMDHYVKGGTFEVSVWEALKNGPILLGMSILLALVSRWYAQKTGTLPTRRKPRSRS